MEDNLSIISQLVLIIVEILSGTNSIDFSFETYTLLKASGGTAGKGDRYGLTAFWMVYDLKH